ncbi:MAG: type II secretion system protein [bacterium]|nr:type II secretion system protein [bacterium]
MKRESGFTLIEVVVATSMFLILIGTVMGIFTTFTRQQRFGIAKATLLGEAQNVIETLEREIRTGFGDTFDCIPPLIPPQRTCAENGLTLKNQKGAQVVYQYDGSRITRDGVALTGTAVEIRKFKAYVRRAGIHQDSTPSVLSEQGRVTIHMKVCPKGIDDDRRCLLLQTTLTSRQYQPGS